MTKEKMTPDPVTAGEVVEHLRAQVNDLAAQLDHSRMANRGWREQMQEVQVTLSRTQQILSSVNKERDDLKVENKALRDLVRELRGEDVSGEPSDEV